MQKSISRRSFLTLVCALAASLLVLLPGAASGAAAQDRAFFPNSIRPLPAKKAALMATNAAANPKEVIEFQVALRMRDAAKLQARLNSGERISQKEMAERYYPTPATYHAIVEWAESNGLKVVDKDPVRLGVRLQGPVQTVEKAIGTPFARYRVNNVEYTATQAVPSLPAAVAKGVLGINGLQPYQQVRKPKPNIRPYDAAIGNQAPYLIKEILRAYNADNLTVTGAGQTIAILIDKVAENSDLIRFWQDNDVPQSVDNITRVNVTNGFITGPQGEETLDESWSSGIASGAKLRVYATSDLSFVNIDKGLQRIIDDIHQGVVVQQLSISLGLGEFDTSPDEIITESQYFQTLASLGVSVFVSTGDDGATPDDLGGEEGPLQASYFSTDPNVTAVGGTSLLLNTDTGVVEQEYVWNNFSGGTGGGESIYFEKPAYQVGPGVDPLVLGRTVPDVSSAADPETGAYLVLRGKVVQIGGTSWSAPMWAGFSALINEARQKSGLPTLGLLNPLIYPLIGTNNFRDITEGNNITPYIGPPDDPNPDGMGYVATEGYDQASGIGVPVVSRLLRTLTAGGTFSITSFNPDSGVPGTVVTINGTLLDRTVQVLFNGAAAAFTPVAPSQLRAVVPVGATTGPITLVDETGAVASSAQPFTVLPSSAGQNDNFANAQALTGIPTTVTGSNVGATKEAGEPNHAANAGGASIWYTFTAPADGTYNVNTFGSSFDTLLAVYTGDSVDTLTEVGSNDDSNSGTSSSVTFAGVAGTTYRIAVDGLNSDNTRAASGTVRLSLSAVGTGPTINNFTPDRGPVGALVTIFGSNFLAASTVSFNGTPATFVRNSNNQITATVPQGATTGPISVTDVSGQTGTSDQFFLVQPAPANDLFANAQALTVPGTVTGTNVGALKEPGEPNHAGNTGGASVWYTFTSPDNGVYAFNTSGSDFDTVLAVYTGNAVDALTPVTSNDDSGTSFTSAVVFQATAGTAYRIAVDGLNGVTGSIRLTSAKVTGKPVILAFSPPSGGAGVPVILTGTGFLSVNAVNFYNNVPAASFRIESDTRITAIVPANASTGPITVSGPNGASTSADTFVVLPLPGNDNFNNAQQLDGGAPIIARGTNGGATKEAGEPNHAGNPGGRSVWYTWNPPLTGTYTISTRGSSFDTLLAVYTGSAVNALTLVTDVNGNPAQNDDDADGGNSSAVTIQALRGVSYRIAVDGVNGDAGSIQLSIVNAGETKTLYATEFEPVDGFTAKQPLVGQSGWVARYGSGGNGITVGEISGLGQQAFIGRTPPAAGDTGISVNHPLNFFPTADFPVVQFSTTMQILRSTNGSNDKFGFGVYDVDGNRLFGLLFDNATRQVYFDNGNPAASEASGVTFANSVAYPLDIVIDYQNQVWSATLNGQTLANEQPLNQFGIEANLGSIDAQWSVTDPAAPGDNVLLFDQYSVTAPQAQAPVITVQPASQTKITGQPVTFSVVVVGTPPLTYQWSFNGAPIAGATGPSYSIASVQPLNAGNYTVQVTNDFGTVTSLAATLVVSTVLGPPPGAVVDIVVKQRTVSETRGGVASFLLTRSGDTANPLTVTYAVQGSAVPGLDYKALPGTLTFKAGQAKKKIIVRPINRGLSGGKVKITITLQAGEDFSVNNPPKRPKVFIIRDAP